MSRICEGCGRALAEFEDTCPHIIEKGKQPSNESLPPTPAPAIAQPNAFDRLFYITNPYGFAGCGKDTGTYFKPCVSAPVGDKAGDKSKANTGDNAGGSAQGSSKDAK